MCGIAGYIKNSSSFNEADASLLSDMTDALLRRGPDSRGLWFDNDIGLGHRRLSIIDLSDSAIQPMHSGNNRYAIVFNGEIYNYRELKSTLRARGVQFKSDSDTEVILESINLWGIDKATSSYRGMYAFALWDKQDKHLYLVRDQSGIKPLYWSHTPKGLIFASEIKALKIHPEFDKEIDPISLGDFFSNSYIAGSGSIYKNCSQVMPGEIIRISHTGHIERHKIPAYRHISYDPHKLSEKDLIQAFEDEMKNAISLQMRADVPVAAFLSGGNDSSLICGLLKELKNFKTFSVGYSEKSFDESAQARNISALLGFEHETLIIEPKDVQNILEKFSDLYDEPFGDSSAIPTYLLSSHVRGSHTVALSGDGADELFAGYPRYRHAVEMWKKINHIPHFLKTPLSKLANVGLYNPFNALLRVFLSSPQKSIPYFQDLLAEKSICTFFQRVNYIGVLPDMLGNSYILEENRFQRYQPDHTHDLLRQLLEYDQSYRLPDAMLKKVDRASMAASLEVRVPYLDQAIVEFSQALSPNQLVSRDGKMKQLIKSLLVRHLPQEIVNSPKVGFHIPMTSWLRLHYRDWACDLLSGEDQYLNMSSVRRYWEKYETGDCDNLFYNLWPVLVYRQWSLKEGL